MARDKITEYSSTASENTVVGDVNIAENSALPSDMNNAVREVLSHQKEAFGSGTPLYVDQTNNRVGVNNSSPTVALDVSGALSVSGAFTSQGIDDNADAVAITITSGENVGIGETSSANLLHVKASDTGITPHASAQIVLEREGTNYLQFLTAETGTSGILFGDGSDVDVAQIKYDHNSTVMSFVTEASERMRIDSLGNLLVGATSSNAGAFGAISPQILVAGTIPQVALHETDTDKDGYIGISSSTMFIQTADAIPIRFGTSDAERVRIMSSGEVGIGETNPAQYFSSANQLVIRDGTANAGLTIRTGSSGAGTIAFADGATTALQQYNGYIEYTHGTNALAFATEASERMRIDASGNVGIGTSSPVQKLTIGTTSDNATRMQFLSATNGVNTIHFGDGTGTDAYRGYISYSHTNEQMEFAVGTTERMKITSSGQFVMVGVYNDTTSDSANVHVRSDGLHRRSTSSRRFKNTINDATHGLTEVLALRPVTFKGNNDGDKIFGGLIAEEVHDAGLTEFVQYNEDNQPDALAYGNMVSLCIKAIQELKAENTALANRITALEGA